MKLRLTGTEAECARVTFLLRYGPPDLEIVAISKPYPNRGDRRLVRVYLEARFPDRLPPGDRVFYSLQDPDGNPLLVDAWGNPVEVSS